MKKLCYPFMWLACFRFFILSDMIMWRNQANKSKNIRHKMLSIFCRNSFIHLWNDDVRWFWSYRRLLNLNGFIRTNLKMVDVKCFLLNFISIFNQFVENDRWDFYAVGLYDLLMQWGRTIQINPWMVYVRMLLIKILKKP